MPLWYYHRPRSRYSFRDDSMYLLPVLLALCLWRAARADRSSRAVSVAIAAALFLWCWPPVAWLNVASLERRYPIATFPSGDAEAIVALAANHYASNPTQREAEPGFATQLRCAHAAWLFHHWKRLPIIVSGGTGEAGDPPIAELMRRQLLAAGVPDALIQVEGRSQTTHENAVETARILRPKGVSRIALVTEGFHMPRAESCFRRQGFDVTPAPCAYRTFELTRLTDFLLPRRWAIQTNEDALHEWLGLFWYKLRGRI